MKRLTVLILSMVFVTGLVQAQITTVLQLPDPCNLSIHQFADASDPLLVVFPNPNEGEFEWSIAASSVIGEASLEILSMEGKLMVQEQVYIPVESYSSGLDIRHLAKGFYILRLRNKVYQVNYKLILK